MKSKETVEQELLKTGVKISSNKNAVKSLPENMLEDEQITTVLDATSLGVLTNKRLIRLMYGILSGTDVTSTNLENINAVNLDVSLISATLNVVTTSGTKLVFVSGSKAEAKRFKESLETAIEQNKSVNKTQSNSNIDVVSQLEKLAELKSKGILTDEEFTEQKKKLLAQ